MDSRHYPGNSHWYHETLATGHDGTSPLVPEAAAPDDPFLLAADNQATEPLRQMLQQTQPALLAARDLYHLLFPATVSTSRLHTLTLYDRLSSALTVAQVCGIQRLCNHYAARLNPLPGPDSSRESNRRLTQITEYARLMSSQPSALAPEALLRLTQAGLTLPDIVTFHQLIGFVGYQARVVAGLYALQGLPVRWIPGVAQPDDAAPFRCEASLRWQAALDHPPLSQLSDDQRDAVTFSAHFPLPPGAAVLLAQDEALLSGVTRLSKALPAPRGISLAVCARINGSAWCLQQHEDDAQRQALLADVEQVYQHPSFNDDERRCAALAAQLTRAPDRFSAAHLQPLRENYDNAALWLLIQQVALANWRNRLWQTLGSLTTP